ncbi:Peptidase family M23 [Pseudonocardia thermophila]|mgnify:CR=1 FL=1|uniref:Peptidase family M23 n=1 Tax=Pseudonocardia thermophila TaxID=1848 RepID=A0A1M7ABP7_PSETH|nr:M23 family metallopeptidase [Pseudonocardia thermophila]SHL40100.1 Peptidase family M23 [Pseudonocardia thermophila]
MARHRSPSGAEAADPDRTTRLRIVPVPEVRRLPPPPVSSTHGRATVAAVAAGAVVAAGQTLASSFMPAEAPTSALLPVATVTTIAERTDPGGNGSEPQFAVRAVGGDQATTAAGYLDPGAELDIKSLTKAAELGEKAAREAKLLKSALSGGAPEAHVVDGRAYVRPVLGRLTSLYGARWGVTHYGIDIANSIGTPIFALTDGEVEEAGPASGFGLWVVVRHTDGTRSVYGHVNRMFVKEGQKVAAGQKIAEVGNRGQSTGPHLHLEIWDADGNKLNPVPWLVARGITFPGL